MYYLKKFFAQLGPPQNKFLDPPLVICDGVPAKLKGKLHIAVVRPALTQGLEAAPMKRMDEKKLDIAEIKMLNWSVGVTRREQIRN